MKREREYAVAAIVIELCGCDLIFLFCCIDCDPNCPIQRRKRTTAVAWFHFRRDNHLRFYIALSVNTIERDAASFSVKKKKKGRLPRTQLDHIRLTGRSESLAVEPVPTCLHFSLYLFHYFLASSFVYNNTVRWTTGMFFLFFFFSMLENKHKKIIDPFLYFVYFFFLWKLAHHLDLTGVYKILRTRPVR